MPPTYPKSSTFVANTDATAAAINALRSDAVEARIVSLTAGENLTALDPVYVKAADGKAYRAKTGGTSAEAVFFAFALTSVSSGASVNVLCFGYMDGFSSLTIGARYYLGATYGTITATYASGSNPALVGIAVSATTMLVGVPQAPGPLTVVKTKTANESVASSTVLQNDDVLFIPVEAGETWLVHFNLMTIPQVSTGGLKWSVTWPTASAAYVNHFGATNTSGTAAGMINSSGTAISYAFENTYMGITASAYIVATAGGNIQLQFAQVSSHANLVTMLAGSSMVAYRVA